MQLGFDRRHRLHEFEVPEVIKALRLLLLDYLERKEDLYNAEIAFKAFFRLIKHQSGRPDYPNPLNWQVMEEYINGTVFSSNIEEESCNE